MQALDIVLTKWYFWRNVQSILSLVKDAWEDIDLSQKELKNSTAKIYAATQQATGISSGNCT